MALTVNTNVAAQSAMNNLNATQAKLSDTLGNISSGLRVNSAEDDAAGLGVATNLNTIQSSGKQAMRNTNDGISVIQTAEGASDEIVGILQRMRELAVQGASDTLHGDERSYINDEYSALSSEVDRIANSTEFNGIQLLNSGASNIDVQVGVNGDGNSQITIAVDDLTAGSSGLNVDGLTMTTSTGSASAIATLDSALTTMNNFRSSLGSTQNRLDVALSTMTEYTENLSGAESRISDADFAVETAEMTKLQIMQQAGIASLAQARQLHSGVVSLLG